MNDDRMTQLAAAFRGGDPGSFGELVNGLTRMLIAMAYRYTSDWETARDLTQDTWLRVHARIDTYQADRPFRNWLLAIHRNGCLSHLRLAATRREQTADYQELTRLSPPAPGPDPLETVARHELGARIRRALARLGARQRCAPPSISPGNAWRSCSGKRRRSREPANHV